MCWLCGKILICLLLCSLAGWAESPAVGTRDAVVDKLSVLATVYAGLPSRSAPLTIDHALLKSVDTSRTVNRKQFEQLQLEKIPSPHGDHYLEIPVCLVDLSDTFTTALLWQYSENEEFCRLLTYSPEGDMVGVQNVYYDNAEGMAWTNSTVLSKNMIAVSEGNIYENDGREVVDTVYVDAKGHFSRKSR